MRKFNQGIFIKKIFQRVMWPLFIFYIGYLLWRLYFYAYGNYFRNSNSTIHYNLIPFKTIMSFIKNYKSMGLQISIINIIGNIAAFAPLGFFLPILINKINTLGRTVMFTFLFSLFVETLQLVSKLGTFDVDDIFLNVLGGMLGYAMAIMFVNLLSQIDNQNIP